MEYWVPWGDSEVFFEAPDELSAITPSSPQMSEEEISSKFSALAASPTIVIDYLPPAKTYDIILGRLSDTNAQVYVSTWRIGEDKSREVVEELKSLGRTSAIRPLSDLSSLQVDLGAITLVYPGTSKILLQGFAENAGDILRCLLGTHGRGLPEISPREVRALELHFSPDGLIQAVWTEDEEQSIQKLNPDSILVTPGKFPLDSTFYLMAQSIILAATACTDKTTILSAAECREGLGPPEFVKHLYDYIKAAGEKAPPQKDSTPSQILAFKFAEAVKHNRTYLATPLPRSIIQNIIGLKTYETVQEGVSQLLRLHGRDHRMFIIRDGLHTAPNIKPPA